VTPASMVECGGGVLLERGVPCRLSDGVTLYSDHYYPSGGGQNPTLLMRQPYGRDIASTVVYAHPAWFARQGYNVVIQDVRGRGDSEGEFYPFRHEARDGAETIAWLRTRPESNGSIGMYGFSYQGLTQLLAAAEQPEGLVCIAPAMTACDLYHGWFYQGGALRLSSTLGWGLQLLKADARRLKLCEASDLLERSWQNLPAQFLHSPYASHPALQCDALPTYLRDWIEHDRPGDYWAALDVSRTLAKIDIPALHLTGWYDTYLRGSIDGFLAMNAHAAHQYLLAGPWIHIPWGDRIGPHSLGVEANLDTDVLLLRWFNHWLKGTGEFAAEPAIRHFALNEGRWHSADRFPEPTQTLYLHSAGRANSSKGDGKLSHEPPLLQSPPDLFVHDPEVPVAAPGIGPANQAVLELGNNILIYTSATLGDSLHVFGTVQFEIYFATSAQQADLVATLICVKPSGEASFIAIGCARSSYLFKDSYVCDRTHLWRFALEPTSCVFAEGERLRIEIAASAYPLFDLNPGTDIAPRNADSWTWRRSTHSIFHDAQHPSLIRLPIAEATP
jgi:putative CocE/NonD family hydrolase